MDINKLSTKKSNMENIKDIAYWLKSRANYDHWGVGKISGVDQEGANWMLNTATTAQQDIDKLIDLIEKSETEQINILERLQEHLRDKEFTTCNYTEEIDDCITEYIEKLTGNE